MNKNRTVRMRKAAAIALLAGLPLLGGGSALAKGATNDFPTSARADYVFACMASTKQNQDYLRKCSCAIDTIASRLSFDDYEAARSILSLQLAHNQRAEAYRGTDVTKRILEPLYRAEAVAQLRCF